MDRSRKLSRVYQESNTDSSSQRDQLRLSSIEQGLEDYDSEEPSTGHTGYVKTVKPYKGWGHSLASLAKLVSRTKKEFEDFEGGLTPEMVEY